MTTVAQKNTALKTWIRSVTGFGVGNVILRNAGGNRPVGEYIVFDTPATAGNVGTPFAIDSAAVGGVVTRTHTQFVAARVGVDVYSGGGDDYLDRLRLSTAGYSARHTLALGDLVFFRKSPNVYIPGYGDTDPRDRYHADFYFYTQKDFLETDFELQKLSLEIQAVRDDNTETTAGIEVGEIEIEEED